MKHSHISILGAGILGCLAGIVIGPLTNNSGDDSGGVPINDGKAVEEKESATDTEEVLRMFAETSPDTWLSDSRDDLTKWALQEPDRVLRFIDSLSLASRVKVSAVLLVFEKLVADGKHSADELLALARTLPKELRVGALSPLYKFGNADLSLEERWRWITQQQDGLGMNVKHVAFLHLVEHAGDRDLDQLKALVLEAPSEIRQDLAQDLAMRLTEQDPVAAFRWASAKATHEALQDEEFAMIPVMEAPEALFDEVLSMGPSSLRDQLVEMIVSRASSLKLSQMERVLELSGDSIHPAFKHQLLAKAFEADTEGGLRWGEKLPYGRNRDDTLRALAMIASKKDVSKALAWVDDLPNDQSKFLAFQEISREQAREDPRKALGAISAIGDLRRRGELQQIVAFEWGYQEPEAALDWAATLSHSARNSIERVILKGALRKSPADFNRMANAMVDERDPEVARPEFGAALGGIALEDGQSPDAFIERYREHIGASEAVDALVVKNALAKISSDVKAASEWLATLPAGNLRDQSISYLVRRLAAVEPDSAAAWAREIGDAAMRQKMIEAVGKANPTDSSN